MQNEIMKLVRIKYRLVILLLLVLFICYFGLPFTLAFFPEVMSIKTSIGGLSIIWIYTFLQIPLTWILGWIYYKKARKFEEGIRSLRDRGA